MNGGMQPPPTAYRAAAGTGFAAPGTAKAGMRGLASRGGGRPGKCAPVTSQPFVMSMTNDIGWECRRYWKAGIAENRQAVQGPRYVQPEPEQGEKAFASISEKYAEDR